MLDHYNAYIGRLQSVLVPERASEIERLALSLKDAWETKKQVFLCGNGGSAGNAIHLANDFNYGIDKKWNGTSCGSFTCERCRHYLPCQ
ncbi:SIS domain protein [Leptospira interrogans serovar Pyrogenes str. L0374]|uniref:SIS domain protein n=1 Tax=Leptospira interrogans serovar Pyrogenes str. L0374 TaxID=1049928 RepID=M6K6U1_LEPIR|nr:SIS domain protein [Leptospira interrogans serovar Pyrogenes str. L0374]